MGRIGGSDDEGLLDQIDIEDLLQHTDAMEAYCCTDESGDNLVLCSKLDESGRVVWQRARDPEGMLRRTVQMSQMASMIKDNDRNRLYGEALKRIVENFHRQQHRPPVCIDIGSGTGLLSLLAVRAGASEVIACEMWEKMASLCEKTVLENGASAQVQVVHAKSLDLELLEGAKADILVSELLDSALLGESVIFSHADALSRLVKDSNTTVCLKDRVIPHSADVYATLVQSSELAAIQRVNPSSEGFSFGSETGTPYRTEHARRCMYSHAVPVHWRELQARSPPGQDRCRELSDPTPILSFEFFHPCHSSGCTTIYETDIEIAAGGQVDGVLLYWNLNLLPVELDPMRELVYSTRPGAQNWQDHWVQVAHTLPLALSVSQGDVIRLTAFHDNLRIWVKCIKLETQDEEQGPKKRKGCSLRASPCPEGKESPQQCECGWHLLCTNDRIGAINDAERRGAWHQAVKQLVHQCLSSSSSPPVSKQSKQAIMLDLSEESFLSFAAAHCILASSSSSPSPSPPSSSSAAPLLRIVSRETKLANRMHFEQLAVANNIPSSMLEVWDGENLEDIFDDEGSDFLAIVISECFNQQMSAKPMWGAIAFLLQCRALQHKFSPTTIVMPSAGRIMVVGIELEHLTVSHGAVGAVAGFQHAAFDECMSGWESNSFPYKLNDYRFRELTARHGVVGLDFQHAQLSEMECLLPVTSNGRLDCVAIWVDYSPGLENVSDLEFFDSPHTKHNLRFFETRQHVSPGAASKIRVTSLFVDTDLTLAFNVEE